MAFRDRIQETINKGLKTSHELFDKAREKAKDLGEKGVLKLEITQLEARVEKLYAKLGTAVFRHLVDEDHKTISSGTPGVKETLEEISEAQAMIEAKEKLLKEFE